MTSHVEATRRLRPHIFDTDWMMLRGLTRAITSHLSERLNRGQRLLDFGCGVMPYRALVEERGAIYLGADFGGNAMVSIMPDGSLDAVADASVDIVLSVQVLEHVRDLDRYFAEIDRVLKPDGTLLLSTHGTWLFHPHPEDHRRWTRTGLAHDIETRGFRVEAVESIVGPLATTTMIRLTGFAFFLRRIPVVGSAAAGLLAVVMNARGWIEDRLTPCGIRDDNGCVYLTLCRKAGR
ncbi:class I SAM-dependent methyltransferase [Sphingopyxis sp. GW247-27LB]|uniref:class I SAM-dependent methyltransferase n=1 Tax=Sphingopyxis sp. GW247-27LB TaxID=2012632 RepID=UPI0015962336|nr:class I SAM-dependent methyltransferase [Sphingopyxis sp. GW247-27LB]